jgi:hypothetical protein
LLEEGNALWLKGVEELPRDPEDAWYCTTADGLVYEINRPAAWFKNRGAVSGETILTIPQADKANGRFDFMPQMKINDDSKIKQLKKDGGRRQLAPKSVTILASPAGLAPPPADPYHADQLPTFSLRLLNALWSRNVTPQQLVRLMVPLGDGRTSGGFSGRVYRHYRMTVSVPWPTICIT